MELVVGMDVHKDTVAVSIVDRSARERCRTTIENTVRGHGELLEWLSGRGEIARVGMELSGGIGYRLGERLSSAGHRVVAVPPRMSSRETRRLRRAEKSDPTDALAIARVTLREPGLPIMRLSDLTQDLKLLVDYRDQLWAERTRITNRLHADLSIAYPGYQRSVGRSMTSRAALARIGNLVATDGSLRAELARRRLERVQGIDEELRTLERKLADVVAISGTSLTDMVGVSTMIAARILGEVGDVRRFTSAAAFAASNGTAPIPASSGRTDRHRLNRGGNRRLNRALYFVALTQMQHDPRAVAYLQRKRTEGKTGREALRCLKRRLSDVIYRQLLEDCSSRVDT